MDERREATSLEAMATKIGLMELVSLAGHQMYLSGKLYDLGKVCDNGIDIEKFKTFRMALVMNVKLMLEAVYGIGVDKEMDAEEMMDDFNDLYKRMMEAVEKS